MMASNTTRFHELLIRVCGEHDRELSVLHAHIATLQARLGDTRQVASERFGMPGGPEIAPSVHLPEKVERPEPEMTDVSLDAIQLQECSDNKAVNPTAVANLIHSKAANGAGVWPPQAYAKADGPDVDRSEAISQMSSSLLHLPSVLDIDDGSLPVDGGFGPTQKCEPAQKVATVSDEVSEVSSEIAQGSYPSASYTSSKYNSVFSLKPVWLEEGKFSEANTKDQSYWERISIRMSNLEYSEQLMNTWRRSDEPTFKKCLRLLMVHPTSPSSLVINFLGLVALAYDCVTVPLMLMDPPENLFMSVGSMSVRVFWTLDMFTSFCRGYYENGNVVMDPRLVATHYLRSWFPIDLGIVSIDWCSYVAGEGDSVGNASRLTKTVRLFRFLRAFRLLRLMKLKEILTHVLDHVSTSGSSILFAYMSICKIITCILIVNHLIACLWYAVSEWENTDQNWLALANLKNSPFGERYTASFHWALSHLSGAEVDIMPHTAIERCYAIVVLLFAIVMFSSLVSSLTHILNFLRSMKEDEVKQFSLVRRFLREHKITKDLSMRIFQYLQFSVSRRNNQLTMQDIKIFQHLSEPLAEELQHSVYSPHLAGPLGHPLMLALRRRHNLILTRVCRAAVTPVHLARSDVLFWPGEIAHKMYFITKGNLNYRKKGDGAIISESADRGCWLSEATLYTFWVHRGDLTALTEAEILAVDSHEFGQIVQLHPKAFNYVKTYAEQFIARLNELPTDALVDFKRRGPTITRSQVKIFANK